MPADLALPLVLAQAGSNAALYTFLIYTLAVFALAWFANKLLQSKSFLSEYFLGSRSLGMWAFALTFAATSASGGSFTGFPAKIYSHGWILAVWIASYMVVPICAMGLLAKRINQVARISGAITVPDVLRDRFRSASFGLLATGLIIFFMSFNLVAQFKAGSLILRSLVADVELFRQAAVFVGGLTGGAGFFEQGPQYLLCLLAFGIAVIVYTTYGGFHAVVWTDVMQGVVMVAGVLILLPLALYQVGGLKNATRQMAEMTPPRQGTVVVSLESPAEADVGIRTGRWLALERDEYLQTLQERIDELQTRLAQVDSRDAATAAERKQIADEIRRLEAHAATLRQGPPAVLFRVVKTEVIRRGREGVERIERDGARVADPVDVIELTTPRETITQAERLRRQLIAEAEARLRRLDAHPSASAGGEIARLRARIARLEATSVLDEPELLNGRLMVSQPRTRGYAYGSGEEGRYVTGPGPSLGDSFGFLPLSLAISFFFMWAISGSGQPSNMVRLMAFNNSTTLRRAMFTVAIYYTAIYFPLVIIFCCARVLMPGMDGQPDEIMPQMALELTRNAGQAWLAGLLVAAPFAAVMSTVDSFLLMISSALVRDVYQRNINPDVSERTIKWMSYGFTLLVGTGAMLGAMNPPLFLQDIIVYTGSGLAACFLAPVAYGLYWPRVNTVGATSGMAAGFLAHLAMYVTGWFVNGSFFRPYQVFDFDPIIVGLAVSFVTVYVVSKLTPPPAEDLVRKYFYRSQEGARPAPAP